MFHKFSQLFDRGNPHKAPEGRSCDYPDCSSTGEHRAPRSRQQLEKGEQDWLWFCLEHVRAYNSKWNYFDGMSEAAQLKERLDDMVWQRPSWPLGKQGAAEKYDLKFEDPLGIFDHQDTHTPPVAPPTVTSQRQADLTLLDLNDDFSKMDLQQRYRLLAKQYHPDTNPDADAVDKFRQVTEAYDRLKQC
ncbi:DnaJ domain-containing protein [Candidatus Odyssella thessalonicensis]|uniref:DnaJ domain-containing protein n=1 Tax=Candidatus Odyssella thessalonicensis TaxID=84647 RepID=UPI000225B20A|nr:DnaJ domain-containing protein [Candidatus Odyssella thessalonicensis]